jgi:hypothetical protein
VIFIVFEKCHGTGKFITWQPRLGSLPHRNPTVKCSGSSAGAAVKLLYDQWLQPVAWSVISCTLNGLRVRHIQKQDSNKIVKQQCVALAVTWGMEACVQWQLLKNDFRVKYKQSEKMLTEANKWVLRVDGFMDYVRCPEFWITIKHNVPETGSVSVFRWGKGDAYSVGSLRRS